MNKTLYRKPSKKLSKRKNKTIKKNKKLNISLHSNAEPVVQSNFEGGSIIQKKMITKQKKTTFILEFEYDTPHKSGKDDIASSWFYFSVNHVLFKNCDFFINNAPILHNQTWRYYEAMYSYNNKDWKYLKNTKFDSESLSFSIKPTENKIYFAYYIPFKKKDSNAIRLMLEESFLTKRNNFRLKKINIGKSVMGIPMFAYKISNKKYEKCNKNLWLLAGQHPNETIGIYTLKGFLLKLLKDNAELCKQYNIYCVIQCNPDGNYYGKSRLNYKGFNLNRCWIKTKYQECPEVFNLKRAIENYGCNMLIDFHGDEQTKKHFITYNDSYNEKHNQTIEEIKAIISNRNENFQINDFYLEDTLEKQHNPSGTADDYGESILNAISFTIEGAIQHKKYKTKKYVDSNILKESYKFGSDIYVAVKTV